jgi:hypothetical protein
VAAKVISELTVSEPADEVMVFAGVEALAMSVTETCGASLLAAL